MAFWHWHNNREDLLAQPFPEAWESYLRDNVAHFGLLSPTEQAAVRKIVQVMVPEKSWEGCHGLEATDEMKVTIAAQASLMLLGIEHDYFSRVRTVLIYPSGFHVPADRWQADSGGGMDASGQAIYRGPVILAWDEALGEARDPGYGSNVVIHEFAHQLDFLDGYMGGTPELPDRQQAEHWEQVMASEFKNHVHNLRTGHRTLLGEYAGSNRTEFFAVVCERFFTVPMHLRRAHPDLYELLISFFHLDPEKWFRGQR